MNKSNLYRLIIILTLVFAIQACLPETATPTLYPTPRLKSVSDEVRDDYLASIDPLLDEWEAVNQLMSDRGRGAYDRVVKLQEIRNEFAQLEIDPYFDELHTQMILHMDCQIAAYVALMSSRDYSSIEFRGEPFELLEEPEVIFERCSLSGAE
ncbi:MAG: hypothetical protein B6243_07145 [Anaerolineaceae bacterium 4572_5.2]|nr:MAG: hypothetical protein B6243_07145 [Anaerolineaceae bacterium 4572_5.2]